MSRTTTTTPSARPACGRASASLALLLVGVLALLVRTVDAQCACGEVVEPTPPATLPTMANRCVCIQRFDADFTGTQLGDPCQPDWQYFFSQSMPNRFCNFTTLFDPEYCQPWAVWRPPCADELRINITEQCTYTCPPLQTAEPTPEPPPLATAEPTPPWFAPLPLRVRTNTFLPLRSATLLDRHVYGGYFTVEFDEDLYVLDSRVECAVEHGWLDEAERCSVGNCDDRCLGLSPEQCAAGERAADFIGPRNVTIHSSFDAADAKCTDDEVSSLTPSEFSCEPLSSDGGNTVLQPIAWWDEVQTRRAPPSAPVDDAHDVNGSPAMPVQEARIEQSWRHFKGNRTVCFHVANLCYVKRLEWVDRGHYGMRATIKRPDGEIPTYLSQTLDWANSRSFYNAYYVCPYYSLLAHLASDVGTSFLWNADSKGVHAAQFFSTGVYSSHDIDDYLFSLRYLEDKTWPTLDITDQRRTFSRCTEGTDAFNASYVCPTLGLPTLTYFGVLTSAKAKAYFSLPPRQCPQVMTVYLKTLRTRYFDWYLARNDTVYGRMDEICAADPARCTRDNNSDGIAECAFNRVGDARLSQPTVEDPNGLVDCYQRPLAGLNNFDYAGESREWVKFVVSGCDSRDVNEWTTWHLTANDQLDIGMALVVDSAIERHHLVPFNSASWAWLYHSMNNRTGIECTLPTGETRFTDGELLRNNEGWNPFVTSASAPELYPPNRHFIEVGDVWDAISAMSPIDMNGRVLSYNDDTMRYSADVDEDSDGVLDNGWPTKGVARNTFIGELFIDSSTQPIEGGDDLAATLSTCRLSLPSSNIDNNNNGDDGTLTIDKRQAARRCKSDKLRECTIEWDSCMRVSGESAAAAAVAAAPGTPAPVSPCACIGAWWRCANDAKCNNVPSAQLFMRNVCTEERCVNSTTTSVPPTPECDEFTADLPSEEPTPSRGGQTCLETNIDTCVREFAHCISANDVSDCACVGQQELCFDTYRCLNATTAADVAANCEQQECTPELCVAPVEQPLFRDPPQRPTPSPPVADGHERVRVAFAPSTTTLTVLSEGCTRSPDDEAYAYDPCCSSEFDWIAGCPSDGQTYDVAEQSLELANCTSFECECTDTVARAFVDQSAIEHTCAVYGADSGFVQRELSRFFDVGNRVWGNATTLYAPPALAIARTPSGVRCSTDADCAAHAPWAAGATCEYNTPDVLGPHGMCLFTREQMDRGFVEELVATPVPRYILTYWEQHFGAPQSGESTVDWLLRVFMRRECTTQFNTPLQHRYLSWDSINYYETVCRGGDAETCVALLAVPVPLYRPVLRRFELDNDMRFAWSRSDYFDNPPEAASDLAGCNQEWPNFFRRTGANNVLDLPPQITSLWPGWVDDYPRQPRTQSGEIDWSPTADAQRPANVSVVCVAGDLCFEFASIAQDASVVGTDDELGVCEHADGTFAHGVPRGECESSAAHALCSAECYNETGTCTLHSNNCWKLCTTELACIGAGSCSDASSAYEIGACMVEPQSDNRPRCWEQLSTSDTTLLNERRVVTGQDGCYFWPSSSGFSTIDASSSHDENEAAMSSECKNTRFTSGERLIDAQYRTPATTEFECTQRNCAAGECWSQVGCTRSVRSGDRRTWSSIRWTKAATRDREPQFQRSFDWSCAMQERNAANVCAALADECARNVTEVCETIEPGCDSSIEPTAVCSKFDFACRAERELTCNLLAAACADDPFAVCDSYTTACAQRVASSSDRVCDTFADVCDCATSDAQCLNPDPTHYMCDCAHQLPSVFSVRLAVGGSTLTEALFAAALNDTVLTPAGLPLSGGERATTAQVDVGAQSGEACSFTPRAYNWTHPVGTLEVRRALRVLSFDGDELRFQLVEEHPRTTTEIVVDGGVGVVDVPVVWQVRAIDERATHAVQRFFGGHLSAEAALRVAQAGRTFEVRDSAAAAAWTLHSPWLGGVAEGEGAFEPVMLEGRRCESAAQHTVRSLYDWSPGRWQHGKWHRVQNDFMPDVKAGGLTAERETFSVYSLWDNLVAAVENYHAHALAGQAECRWSRAVDDLGKLVCLSFNSSDPTCFKESDSYVAPLISMHYLCEGQSLTIPIGEHEMSIDGESIDRGCGDLFCKTLYVHRSSVSAFEPAASAKAFGSFSASRSPPVPYFVQTPSTRIVGQLVGDGVIVQGVGESVLRSLTLCLRVDASIYAQVLRDRFAHADIAYVYQQIPPDTLEQLLRQPAARRRDYLHIAGVDDADAVADELEEIASSGVNASSELHRRQVDSPVRWNAIEQALTTVRDLPNKTAHGFGIAAQIDATLGTQASMTSTTTNAADGTTAPRHFCHRFADGTLDGALPPASSATTFSGVVDFFKQPRCRRSLLSRARCGDDDGACMSLAQLDQVMVAFAETQLQISGVSGDDDDDGDGDGDGEQDAGAQPSDEQISSLLQSRLGATMFDLLQQSVERVPPTQTRSLSFVTTKTTDNYYYRLHPVMRAELDGDGGPAAWDDYDYTLSDDDKTMAIVMACFYAVALVAALVLLIVAWRFYPQNQNVLSKIFQLCALVTLALRFLYFLLLAVDALPIGEFHMGEAVLATLPVFFYFSAFCAMCAGLFVALSSGESTRLKYGMCGVVAAALVAMVVTFIVFAVLPASSDGDEVYICGQLVAHTQPEYRDHDIVAIVFLCFLLLLSLGVALAIIVPSAIILRELSKTDQYRADGNRVLKLKTFTLSVVAAVSFIGLDIMLIVYAAQGDERAGLDGAPALLVVELLPIMVIFVLRVIQTGPRAGKSTMPTTASGGSTPSTRPSSAATSANSTGASRSTMSSGAASSSFGSTSATA